MFLTHLYALLLNEDFPPFTFSKRLPDTLSNWCGFHSCHCRISLNSKHWKFQNGGFGVGLQRSFLRPQLKAPADFRGVANHGTRIYSRDYCWIVAPSIFWRRSFELSAVRWNKLASGQHRLSEKHNGFAKCNYMYIQKKNYAVLILCKMEKSVLELVILGADRRPCFWGVITTHALAVRRVVYKVSWWVHVHRLILLLKTNWAAYGYKLNADIPDSLKHNTRLCLHKLVVTGYNNICWNCYSFVCFNNNCSETN